MTPTSRALARRAKLIVYGAFMVGLTACRNQPETQPPPATAPVEVNHPPIVIYLIDTLRADGVGAYGGNPALTPGLDALAKESALFEHAYAPAPWTLPSVTSIFTSSFVTEHGITRIKYPIPDSLPTLTERLKSLGYRCGAFVSNANTTPIRATGRGFEASILQDKYYKRSDVETWLDHVGDDPWFMYVHTTEPHNPFVAPLDWIRKFGDITDDERKAANDAMERFRNITMLDKTKGRPVGTTDTTADQLRIMDELDRMRPTIDLLYESHIAWADKHLGEYIALLKERGVWDECIFVLLSDHGEEWGEHGGWQHDQSVYDEVVRVPLMIRIPEWRWGGARYDVPVSLVDVPPTIMQAVSANAGNAGWMGASLAPVPDGRITGSLTGPGQAPPIYVMSVRQNDSKYYRPFKETRGDLNVAMRQGDWKGIYNVEHDSVELYELNSDPAEKYDQSGAKPVEAERFRVFAQDWLAAQVKRFKKHDRSGPVDVDSAAEQNLRRLGYLTDDEDNDSADEREPSSTPSTRPVAASRPL